MARHRAALLALCLAVLGCASGASSVRRAAARGDLPMALRLYNDYVDERGDGDPDLLADVAIALLRDAATSDDARIRQAGFAALRGLGVHGREVLEALAAREGVVGDRATAILYEQDGRRERAPVRLRAALRSNDTERRVAGIVSVRGRRAVARLTALAHDADVQVRTAAVRELARRHGEAGVTTALAEVLHGDTEATVRAAATLALGPCGREAVDALRAALTDADPIVRMAVPGALTAAAPDDAATLLHPLLTERPDNLAIESARVLAARSDADAQAYILRVLREGPRALRPQAAVAALALGASHDAELAAWLNDADPEVAIRVAGILIRRDEHRQASIDALRPIAARPDGFVAIRALGALASGGDPWALDPIRQALASTDANVRRLAVLAWPQAIGSQGSDVEPLVPLLRDPDRSVALFAAMQVIAIAAR